MSIYIQNGLTTNSQELQQTDLTDFQFIAEYQPQVMKRYQSIQLTDNGTKPVPDSYKKGAYVKYFFAGAKVSDTATRNDKNTINKSLITLDIDPVKNDHGGFHVLPVDDVVEMVNDNLSKYNYILYNTINSQPFYARMRLIIEPTEPMNAEETKATTSQVSEILKDINIDTTSGDYSRVQGLPIDNRLGVYTMIINDGEKFPVSTPKPATDYSSTFVPFGVTYGAGRKGKIVSKLEEITNRVQDGGRNNLIGSFYGTLLRANMDPESAIILCRDLNELYFDPPIDAGELATHLRNITINELKKRGEINWKTPS